MTKRCFVCDSHFKKWGYQKVINNKLSEAWNVTGGLRRLYDLREGKFCPNCRNSQRTIGLARSIGETLNINTKSLSETIAYINTNKLKVAEINSCGNLHEKLLNINNLEYSEYSTEKKPAVRSEDIQKLNYKDNTFDIVIHSDTIEHVPDYSLAIKECNRVLRNDGLCIFTIPIVWSRTTVSTTQMSNGEIRHIQPESYHGIGPDFLVWWEFGADFIRDTKVYVYIENFLNQSYVFYFYKDKRTNPKKSFKKYKLLEKIASTFALKHRETAGKI